MGAGRKKTTAKTYGFNAPADVAAILESLEGSKTEYILNAIRRYHALSPQSPVAGIGGSCR